MAVGGGGAAAADGHDDLTRIANDCVKKNKKKKKKKDVSVHPQRHGAASALCVDAAAVVFPSRSTFPSHSAYVDLLLSRKHTLNAQ